MAQLEPVPGFSTLCDHKVCHIPPGMGRTPFSFLLYGYDWLAFAHFVLAILFIGPFRDPVKNIWVIEFGLIACVLVIPLALIAGHFRGIPVGWRLLDCSFGLLGFIPLSISYRRARRLSLLPTSI